MHEGRLLYAHQDHVHVLRYVGDVRHPIAPSIRSFVDSLFERISNDDLVIDLSDTEAIDSTNLGELARIADRLTAHNGKQTAIISTRPEINQVLFSMAFNEVFDICTEPEVPIEAEVLRDGEPIPQIAASQHVSHQVILSAHRRL